MSDPNDPHRDPGGRDDSHDHSHDQDHSHDSAERDPHSDHDLEDRARALQSLLVEKGLLSTDAVDEIVSAFEEDVGPMNGARVVARAWTDPEFKERLLADGTDTVHQGFDFEIGTQDLEFVENTPDQHNIVVCTLCSCYPWSMLGLPPTWYKSPEYRARVPREPRAVLREFGVDLDDDVDVEVWDSNSELRYVVVPQRPAGTERMDEDELADLVTRDAMVGVERLALT